MTQLDKTLRDNNRRDLNLQRSEVTNVLPEHFIEEYPNIITLLEAYYEWMEETGNPDQKIRDLYRSRDLTQVDTELLQYIEDEILLGQAYFGGFINKREASKFSNILYRSKGTRYSIQQFFRAFFGTDPEVIYPKEQVFKVGPIVDYSLDSSNAAGEQVIANPSKIGPEANRFLTNDKLYQTLSILIKSDIPTDTWSEVYKLFVHPAGMYLAGQVQIVSVNDAISTTMPEIAKATVSTDVITTGEALSDILLQPVSDITVLVDSGGDTYRIDAFVLDSDQTLAELNSSYPNILTALSPSLPTFDDNDSDGAAVTMDTTRRQQTLDQDWYDSIGTY
jgi:hypothetical protein